jgi:hypothetical protein
MKFFVGWCIHIPWLLCCEMSLLTYVLLLTKNLPSSVDSNSFFQSVRDLPTNAYNCCSKSVVILQHLSHWLPTRVYVLQCIFATPKNATHFYLLVTVLATPIWALSYTFMCCCRGSSVVVMPQCQFPIFCCFCVSEKLHRKYSWSWTKQKPNLLFLPKLREDRRWDGGGPEASHTTGGAAQPLATPTHGEAAWPTSWRCPFAYKVPSMEKT